MDLESLSSGVLPIRSRSEFDVLHPTNLERDHCRKPRATGWLRRVERVGKAGQRASSPPPRRTAGAASPCSAPALYGVLRPRRSSPARRSARRPTTTPPDATGWYGRGRPGPAIKIALLGDSSAAGYGVDRVEETPGALLASGARRAGRPAGLPARVRGRSAPVLRPRRPARPGAADRAGRRGDPDRRQRRHPPRAARPRRCGDLAEAVRRLTDAGVAVLVGTCPDLGTDQADPAAAQAGRPHLVAPAGRRPDDRGRSRSGGRTVSLGSILGPEFAAAPALLFGPDQFHPSAAGYRSLAAVLLPSMLAALGLIPDDEAEPEALRGEGVLPITAAALQAVNTPGTELDGTEVGGRARGVRGLWVELRHRRRHPRHRGRGARRARRPTPSAGNDDGPGPRSRGRRSVAVRRLGASCRRRSRGGAAGWCRSRPG